MMSGPRIARSWMAPIVPPYVLGRFRPDRDRAGTMAYHKQAIDSARMNHVAVRQYTEVPSIRRLRLRDVPWDAPEVSLMVEGLTSTSLLNYARRDTDIADSSFLSVRDTYTTTRMNPYSLTFTRCVPNSASTTRARSGRAARVWPAPCTLNGPVTRTSQASSYYGLVRQPVTMTESQPALAVLNSRGPALESSVSTHGVRSDSMSGQKVHGYRSRCASNGPSRGHSFRARELRGARDRGGRLRPQHDHGYEIGCASMVG